jgi:hypothetical protein
MISRSFEILSRLPCKGLHEFSDSMDKEKKVLQEKEDLTFFDDKWFA